MMDCHLSTDWSIVKCQCVAFHDVNPQAPVHFLVIPKRPLAKLSASEDSDEQVIAVSLMCILPS